MGRYMNCKECGTLLLENVSKNKEFCSRSCVQKKYRKTKNGWIIITYHRAKHRSKRDGIVFTLIRSEFITFCYNSEQFKMLFSAWEKANFCKNKRVSLDRVDSTKGYEIDNLQFLTVSQNITKGNILNEGNRYEKIGKAQSLKTVIQKGNLVLYFNSGKEASEHLGKHRSAVAMAIKHNRLIDGWVAKYV